MDSEQINKLLSDAIEKQDGKFYALTAVVAGMIDVSRDFPEVRAAISARLHQEYSESVAAGESPLFLESFDTMRTYLLNLAGSKR